MSNGFKNAPTVTAWAVGMEFKYGQEENESSSYRVVYMDRDGLALTVDEDEISRWFDRSKIPHCTLDLKSIWVGSEHQTKQTPHETVIVRSVSENAIGWRRDDDEDNGCCSPLVFRMLFKRVPPAADYSKKAEPPVTETGQLFGGRASMEMWGKINTATTVDDLRSAIYLVCCKLQQLESTLVPADSKELEDQPQRREPRGCRLERGGVTTECA